MKTQSHRAIIAASILAGSIARRFKTSGLDELPENTNAGGSAAATEEKPKKGAKKPAAKPAKKEKPAAKGAKAPAKPAKKEKPAAKGAKAPAKPAKKEKPAAKAPAKGKGKKEEAAAESAGRKPRVDGRVDLVYRSGPERAIAIKLAETLKAGEAEKVDNCTVGYKVTGTKADQLRDRYLELREEWRKAQDALAEKFLAKASAK